MNLFAIAKLYVWSLLAFDSKGHVIACILKQGFRFIWGGWFKVWGYIEHGYMISQGEQIEQGCLNVCLYVDRYSRMHDSDA